MTRAVSAATDAKLGQSATEPGFFIELGFTSATVRHSSRETTAWNGFTWNTAAVKVSGIEGSGQRASLEYFDSDAAMRTLVLGEGINDRRVRIWKFYVGALSAADPALIFEGVGDGSTIRQGRVTIGLSRAGSRTLMTPRLRIGTGTGFNHLPPEGTLINWGRGQTLRLERSRA